MIAHTGINYAARGANRCCLSFSFADFDSIVAPDVTAAFNERLPESSSPHILPTARGWSRPEGDGANGGGNGGGVGRARKIERKGREVVSCRTLDEAHARCETARVFMRVEDRWKRTRTTTVNPGRPQRPGRRSRRDLSPRLPETSSESGYERWCSATAAATDHAAHVRTYTRVTNAWVRRRQTATERDRPRTRTHDRSSRRPGAQPIGRLSEEVVTVDRVQTGSPRESSAASRGTARAKSRLFGGLAKFLPHWDKKIGGRAISIDSCLSLCNRRETSR